MSETRCDGCIERYEPSVWRNEGALWTRVTTHPRGEWSGAHMRCVYSEPSAVASSELLLRASRTHFSIGTWLTTRTLVRPPTARSQPVVGALLRRQTTECASISAPRGSSRSTSELPTTAHVGRLPPPPPSCRPPRRLAESAAFGGVHGTTHGRPLSTSCRDRQDGANPAARIAYADAATTASRFESCRCSRFQSWFMSNTMCWYGRTISYEC